ncbi:hypothetical protein EDD11_008584, partial [Mortierella claussenii]
MPRVKKLTRHLRQIAQGARRPATIAPVNQKQEENVVYAPVQEGDLLNPIQELSRDMEEWNAMLAEPDSDGPVEDETDDKDWQKITRTLGQNEDWSELLT